MKRFICLLLTLLLATVLFVGCGEKAETETTDSTASATETVTTVTDTAETGEPTASTTTTTTTTTAAATTTTTAVATADIETDFKRDRCTELDAAVFFAPVAHARGRLMI